MTIISRRMGHLKTLLTRQFLQEHDQAHNDKDAVLQRPTCELQLGCWVGVRSPTNLKRDNLLETRFQVSGFKL
ncbi:MAG: hypothetical protein AB4426_33655 [Xenococcaceae cyanobacterium]